MAVLKKTGKLSQVSISVLGGVAHNIGQITFAAVIVQTPGVFYYLPFLLAAGCIAGTLIGIVGGNHYGAASACDAGDKKIK